MAEKGTDNAAVEITDTKCSICAGKNITREAEQYCVECQNYYCIPCTDMHTAFPAMRGHKLLDKADFNTQLLQSSLPCSSTERCSIHKAKLLNMFCKSHDEVVCATCIAISHRKCLDIHSVADEADNLYKQSASDQTMNQLTEEKKDTEEIKKAKQQQLSELEKQKKTATDSITDYKKELEVELRKLDSESKKQVHAEYASKERDLLDEIEELDKNILNIEQAANKLKMSTGNIAQELICVKTAQETIVTAKSSIRSIKKRADVKICFSADMKIKNYLKQLQTLGQVSTTKAKYKSRTTAYTVKQRKDIDIRLKTDKTICRIYGSCFAEDGSLLLADHDNERLKRLDVSTGSIIDHLDLDAKPYNVCFISKQEVVVSLINSTKQFMIQFISLEDKMTTTRRLTMDHNCYGLAYNAGRLFISDGNMAVYIHDVTGTMLQKITNDKSGNSMFSQTRHMSISTNRDYVYVTDVSKGLITLDMQGNYLSTFVDTGFGQLCGVCTDGRGNIFVCGWCLQNIIQISEDSSLRVKEIKAKAYPLSVCFDPNHYKIIVSYEDTDSIEVSELQ